MAARNQAENQVEDPALAVTAPDPIKRAVPGALAPSAVEGRSAMAPVEMAPSAQLDRTAMAKIGMVLVEMVPVAMAPVEMVPAEMVPVAMVLTVVNARSAAPSGFRRRRRRSSLRHGGSVVEKPLLRVRASRFWCGVGFRVRRASHWFTIGAIIRTRLDGCRQLAPLQFDVSHRVTNTIGAVVVR